MVGDRKGVSLKVVIIVVAITAVLSFTAGLIWFNRPKADSNINATEIVNGVGTFVRDNVIGSEGNVKEVTSSANLEKIIKISQLRTFSYNYNSICDVVEDHKVVYHIAYKSTVELGIEADEIKYEIDPVKLSVKIILPEVKIQDTAVDPNSLEYIFVDEKYNTPNIGTRAQALCLEDLKKKIADEPLMMELARENTKREVEAMFGPIVSQFYSEYRFEVVFAEPQGGKT